MKKSIQKIKNQGTVLITVIMLILAMMTLAIGILSALGSQGLLGQSQVSRIKADQLAKGYFWRYYYLTANGNNTTALFNGNEVLDNQTYTIVQAVTANTGPYGTTNTITTTVHQ